MYYKTHHGNAIGTLELTAEEVRELLKVLHVVNGNIDNKISGDHILWNETFWNLNSNLRELEKQLVG